MKTNRLRPKQPLFFGNPGLLAALLAASGLGYYLLAYATVRTQTGQLFLLFTILFACYGFIYQRVQTPLQYRWVLAMAMAYRVLLLFALPNLSDDFYRFIWDGRLLLNGINPYAFIPDDWVNGTLSAAPAGINCQLYELLNSPLYFTVYPPLCQGVFYLGALLFGTKVHGAVVVMKLCLLLFEAGSVFLLHHLLRFWQLPLKRTLLYALNPLVIIEIVGNLHFEGAMIFFILASVYYLSVRQKPALSAIALGLAVCSKLLPLLFLPLLVKRLGWRASLRYTFITALVTAACFAPFLQPQTAYALLASTGLYFQKFEFNAGIYYLLRAAGYAITGHNAIAIVGKLLAASTLAAILLLALKEKNATPATLCRAMLFTLFIYLALATTIHPWYVCPLVALCVCTPWRFALLWSGGVLLSYATYQQYPYTENGWLIAAEYIALYGFLLKEWGQKISWQIKP